jgi:hypothetical protein
VCSTTLWVGHLSKLVHQEELSDTFGEYGDIVSIDLIPPRGCAFICMNRRQDAYRALQRLKNHKLQGKAITVSRSHSFLRYDTFVAKVHEVGVCYESWRLIITCLNGHCSYKNLCNSSAILARWGARLVIALRLKDMYRFYKCKHIVIYIVP